MASLELEQREAIAVMRDVVKIRKSCGDSYAEEWIPNIHCCYDYTSLTLGRHELRKQGVGRGWGWDSSCLMGELEESYCDSVSFVNKDIPTCISLISVGQQPWQQYSVDLRSVAEDLPACTDNHAHNFTRKC